MTELYDPSDPSTRGTIVWPHGMHIGCMPRGVGCCHQPLGVECDGGAFDSDPESWFEAEINIQAELALKQAELADLIEK